MLVYRLSFQISPKTRISVRSSKKSATKLTANMESSKARLVDVQVASTSKVRKNLFFFSFLLLGRLL